MLVVSVRRRSEIFLGAFFSLLYRRAHTWHMILCKTGHMCVMHGARVKRYSDRLSELNIEACY